MDSTNDGPADNDLGPQLGHIFRDCLWEQFILYKSAVAQLPVTGGKNTNKKAVLSQGNRAMSQLFLV